ncbi:olfactory receptor 6N2-like [Anableps anableps]
MDDKLNETYITLGGYVEVEKYRYLYFLTILIVYILIICCNCTIVYLIVIHQNLHEPMYIFIAALLLNAVFFSTAVYPKLLVDFMSERQIISHAMCHFQYFLFYTLGGAEFLLLAAMAYDRYLSIFRPLQYPNVMRNTTICVLLCLAWFLPACLVAGSAVLTANHRFCYVNLKGIFCNNSIHKLLCEISRTLSSLGVIILLSIALFPFLFIVFTYGRILVMSHQSSKSVRRKAAQTCLPHLLVLINFSLFCCYDVIVVRLESDISKTARLIMTLQVLLYHPLFNPIIYGLKMKEISKQLKRSADCSEESAAVEENWNPTKCGVYIPLSPPLWWLVPLHYGALVALGVRGSVLGSLNHASPIQEEKKPHRPTPAVSLLAPSYHRLAVIHNGCLSLANGLPHVTALKTQTLARSVVHRANRTPLRLSQ